MAYVYNRYKGTAEELAYVKANWSTKSNREIAAALHLKLWQARELALGMGLKRMEMEYWTDAQVQFLKEYYRSIGDKEIAEIFQEAWPKEKDWTLKHIEKKRMYLGLKRTKEELKAIKERNKQNGCWVVGSQHSWETRGETPTGTIKIWINERGVPYKVIKLLTGFVPYKQWLYEQLYGPVPEGFVVRAKDDDSLNVVPGNLEAVSRAENASRNSKSRHAYPEELKEIIKLNNKLKKLINATNREETAGNVK